MMRSIVNEIGDKEITHCLKVGSNTSMKEALGSAAYVCVFCKCFVFQHVRASPLHVRSCTFTVTCYAVFYEMKLEHVEEKIII